MTILQKPVSRENLPKDPVQAMAEIAKRMTTHDLRAAIKEIFNRKSANDKEIEATTNAMCVLMNELDSRMPCAEFVAFLDSIV